MTAALIAAIALPAAAGGVLLVAGRRLDRVAPIAGVAVAGAVLLLVLIAGGVPAPLPGGVGVGADGLSRIALVLVAAVATLVLVVAAQEREEPPARYTGLMLLFVAAVVLTASATTMPGLLAGWEVMGATSGALIAMRLDDRGAIRAGLTAFVTTRTADLGLYLAAGAVVAGGGSLALADLGATAGPSREVVAAGVIVAALGKAAQLPFSFWLSRAMVGPSTVSALLHSAAMVAMGGYLLLRVRPLLAAVPWAGPAVAWVGALTAIVLGLVALAQTDLKQLLAASTAAQLGFVVLAAGVGAVAGGAAQLMAHAAAKAALFLLAGVWLTRWRARRLDQLGGAFRDDRRAAVLAVLAAAALAGLPLTGIWAAKDLIVTRSPLPLGVAALAAAVIAAAYAARIVRAVLAPGGARRQPARTTVLAPIAVLVAAALATAVVALPPVGEALAAATGNARSPQPSALLVLGSALLALAAFAAGLRWQPRRLPLLTGWLGLERAAVTLVVRPVIALAGAAARADDALALGVVRSGRAVVAAADLVGRLDAAGPAGLLRGAAGAGAALGRAARRPQSGQLHRYYLIATGTLAALVVIAIVVR